MCWFLAPIHPMTRHTWTVQLAQLNMAVYSVFGRAHPSASTSRDSPSHCGAGLIIQSLFFTLIRMAIIKKQKTSAGKDVEKLEPMCVAGGNVK